MPLPLAGSTRQFPIQSLLLFIAIAVLLRALTIAGWAVFPGNGLLPHIARIVVPLVAAAGLVRCNRKFLERDGIPPAALGLRPTPSRLGLFLVGATAITLIVAAVVGALWLIVPFHYQRGPMSVPQLVWQSAEYFAGNWGEELMFRGYLLLVVARRFGVPAALMFTGILFGLFHLPGLSGLSAVKMVGTTFLGGCLYAYGYLLTGTLWTAAGLHVAGNIVLHHLFGASNQPSLFTPVFREPWPTSYDPGFLAWLVVLVPVIALAAGLEHRRRSMPLA